MCALPSLLWGRISFTLLVRADLLFLSSLLSSLEPAARYPFQVEASLSLLPDPPFHALPQLVEARQGDLNAFTGERSTTFYAQLPLSRTLSSSSAASAASQLSRASEADVRSLCDKSAALFAERGISLALLRQEATRVDQEMQAILASPSRGLLQARASGGGFTRGSFTRWSPCF